MTAAQYPPPPFEVVGTPTNGQGLFYNSTLKAWVPESSAAAGTKWWTGVGVPTNVVGAITNDLYLNETTGEVYRSTGGATSWHDEGFTIAGLNGTNGVNGATWWTGAGAPGTVTGAVTGDRYVNTTNGEVYKSTAGSSTWEDQAFSIKGATGEKGAKGEAGGGSEGVLPQNRRPSSIEPFYLDYPWSPTQTLAAGRQYFSYCTALESFTLAHIGMLCGSAAQVAATLIRFGLCTVNAAGEATLVAKTANIATGTPTNLANSTAQNALSVANTEFVYPTEASFAVVKGTRYALTMISVGATTQAQCVGITMSPNSFSGLLYGGTLRKTAYDTATQADLASELVKTAALGNTTFNLYMVGMA